MITYKKNKEIELLRAGGRILARIIKAVAREVKPGATTGQLENLTVELIKKAGGRPSFLGYRSRHDTKAFPTALCASINDEVVHAPALPSRKLKAGDIIGLDIGMEYPFGGDAPGLFTDMAVTVGVGRVGPEAKKLMRITAKALEAAIGQVKPGNGLNDIGRAVEELASRHGFSVVRDLVGHGVGYDVHEDPNVPNFAVAGSPYFENVTLKPGLVIAIEPMVNAGRGDVVGCPDGFTIRTKDGGLSAHFEHTVAVTDRGCLVITR